MLHISLPLNLCNKFKHYLEICFYDKQHNNLLFKHFIFLSVFYCILKYYSYNGVLSINSRQKILKKPSVITVKTFFASVLQARKYFKSVIICVTRIYQ